MILTIDVGNTNIVLGVFDGDTLVLECRLTTNIHETADEYAIKLSSVFAVRGVNADAIDGSIISSVVPPLSEVLAQAVRLLTGCRPLIVGPGLKTGVNIKIDNPGELGADMVVATAASIVKYPLPQIVCDLGTAITISAIDRSGAYLGGAIACGIQTGLGALSGSTAQLPQIHLGAPPKAIGTNTADCMNSGAVFGTAAMIDGLVQRFEQELGEKATVILTGGFGAMIARYCTCETIVDGDLLLDGLRILYNKNKPKKQ